MLITVLRGNQNNMTVFNVNKNNNISLFYAKIKYLDFNDFFNEKIAKNNKNQIFILKWNKKRKWHLRIIISHFFNNFFDFFFNKTTKIRRNAKKRCNGVQTCDAILDLLTILSTELPKLFEMKNP